MTRSRLAWCSLLVLVVAGCGGGGSNRPPGPQPPTKDWAELEERYGWIEVGMTEPEVAAALGKSGAAIAGYSSAVVARKPKEADGALGMAPGHTSKYWASADGKGAIGVVFRTDGAEPVAVSVSLLLLTPMGPPPSVREEPKEP
jgi:hypothetical protein